MPRLPVLPFAVLAAVLFQAQPFGSPGGAGLCGPAGANAADAFVDGIDDLPLMPGLVTVADQALVFDKPGGRIVQAVATGTLDASAIRSFYAETAPQLGWAAAGEGRFLRDGELLRIELVEEPAASGRGGPVTVRFMLIPQ
ncbi:hypothetical protein JL100_029865 [Skermanella mucosa]|uniref:hypothetical protein n=1 Tax=Skermanella mucosa TaxID=1789672 RepID=UPI00192C99C9|nr:hypothetical protein [Skermanella mucosa]UEM21217.1 hypothetical protein JL100_029865 [Skermanella mucosa]